VIYKQKQLASFISAYTYIVDVIENLEEPHVLHFAHVIQYVFT
jgi:hypothetical protein